MAHSKLLGPPGYQELCAKLQIERDPAKFRMLIEEINFLLTVYEKSGLSAPYRDEVDAGDLTTDFFAAQA